MVDAFTSIKTTGGWADEAVAATAYDLLFRGALRTYPTLRAFVDIRPENVTSQAKAYRIFIKSDFSEATVTAAQTALDEETDVSAVQYPAPTHVDLTPTEFGFTTLRTLKLNPRSLVPIEPQLADSIAYHMVRTVDGLLQAKAKVATNQVWANPAHTTANATVAGDIITSAILRQQVTLLRNAMVQPVDADGSYVSILHPFVELELRSETGSGGWLNPNEYGSDQSRIWNGEIGKYQGLRFIVNPRNPVAANSVPNNVYKSYFLGREALAEAVNVEPHIVMGPVIDRLKRFNPLGWYGDLDFQIFRQPAIRVLNSALTSADITALGG